ncbi:MAG: ferredoxin family protein [Conexivisphaerales archaeon]
MNRNQIDWHPIIDEDKCVGCGLCVVTCGEKRNVFGFNLDTKKAVVLYPDNCMVGCDNCRVACLWNAISFPDSTQLKQFVGSLVSSGKISQELEMKIKS